MADDDMAMRRDDKKDENKEVKAMIKKDVFGLRTYRCNAPSAPPRLSFKKKKETTRRERPRE